MTKVEEVLTIHENMVLINKKLQSLLNNYVRSESQLPIIKQLIEDYIHEKVRFLALKSSIDASLDSSFQNNKRRGRPRKEESVVSPTSTPQKKMEDTDGRKTRWENYVKVEDKVQAMDPNDPDTALYKMQKYIAKSKTFTVAKYRRRTGVSQYTAQLYIRKLIEDGYVEMEGSGSGSSYKLTDKSPLYVAPTAKKVKEIEPQVEVEEQEETIEFMGKIFKKKELDNIVEKALDEVATPCYEDRPTYNLQDLPARASAYHPLYVRILGRFSGVYFNSGATVKDIVTYVRGTNESQIQTECDRMVRGGVLMRDKTSPVNRYLLTEMARGAILSKRKNVGNILHFKSAI